MAVVATKTPLLLSRIEPETMAPDSGGSPVSEDAIDWMQHLARAFDEYAPAPPLAGSQPIDPFGKLLAPFNPLIHSARRRLRAGLTALSTPEVGQVDPLSLEPHLLTQLATQLSRLSVRCAVLEMHRARQAGELNGATPEEQFDAFTRQLADPQQACEFLARYPLLARQAVIAVEQWLVVSLEFASRLTADWKQIAKRFFPGETLGQVLNLAGGSGDLHRGGRSVMIVQFAGGQRLVYKPRSLAVEAHFQAVASWLNTRGAAYPLRTLNILDRGDYGWVEFVPPRDAADRPAVERFYHRLGSFAALAYLLGGTDLHAENLLAHGEHPVLIDLEALFHHRLPGIRKDAAALGLTNSVLALQLLPVVSYVEGFERPIDFSGMGSTAGLPTPFRMPVWENVGRSDMRLAEATVETPPGHHCPTLAGQPVNYREYQKAFQAGFTDAYRILLRHQSELLVTDGPLTPFASDHARFIARPTQVYGILLEQALHPQALAMPEMRRNLLARLETRTREFVCLTKVLPHELADLERNDVPLFTAPIAGRELITSTGERLPDFFPESAWELLEQRVRQLSEDDLARQSWFIEAAFAVAGGPKGELRETSDDLAAARRVGDRLLALAHRAGQDIGWNSVHPRGRGWSIGPANCDFATGLPGIALFLAHLAHATGDSRYEQIARQTATAVLDRIDWDPAQRDLLQQQDAAGLVPRVLTHLSTLWNDEDLEQRCQDRFGAEIAGSDIPSWDAAWEHAQQVANGSTDDASESQSRFELPGLQGGLAGQGMRILAGCKLPALIAAPGDSRGPTATL